MMSRRACSVLIGLLAVDVVRTRLRLSQAQTELREARAETLAAAAAVRPRPRKLEQEPTGHITASRSAVPAQELSTEWEQAVPPMDS